MMGDFEMGFDGFGMGFGGIGMLLLIVAAGLMIAALIKYLRS